MRQLDFEIGTLLTNIEASRSLREKWLETLEEKLFLVGASLGEQQGFSGNLVDRTTETIRAFWRLPSDVRSSILDEPLFCDAVQRLLDLIAGTEYIKDKSEDLANALALLGSLILESYLRHGAKFSIDEPINIYCRANGGIELPNRPERLRLGSALHEGWHRITCGGSGLLTIEDTSTQYEVDRDVAWEGAEPVTFRGGIRLENGSWYRRAVGDFLTDEQYADPYDDATNGQFNRGIEILSARAPRVFDDLLVHAKVIVPTCADASTGFSLDTCRAAMFINLEEQMVDTVDHMVHEAGHNKLDTVNDLYPLLQPEDAGLFPSPWRQDPRPMEGIVHGAYVFTLVGHTFAKMMQEDSDLAALSVRVDLYKDQVAEALETINANAQFTNAGQEFFNALWAWHEQLGYENV